MDQYANSICAIVIWYNPEPRFVKNISSYYNLVDFVVVVDNSSHDNSHLISHFCRLKYVSLKENMGIAAALNTGCNIAMLKGFKIALTLDQDSAFDENELSTMISQGVSLVKQNAVAIVAPSHRLPKTSGVSFCDYVITSGNLFMLDLWREVGGFNEDLFIDQVDHEFCYRLRRLGFFIIKLNNVYMQHVIGLPISRSFLGKELVSTNHSAQRRYYIIRNRLYLRRNFPEFPRPYFYMMLRDIFFIIFFEKAKYKKLKAVFLGFLDNLNGKLGRRDIFTD
ncbi:glycosyltransferase family 2 protein [Halomonas sp. LR5S13]|uniref:glycosyltransferase family 2 protein n=1 Tax=Halomonas rhizosphaerae TaxID=3043296 RepID=UPI0024A8AFAA|nr:glycosyltransferase family 2 protein [Halomonas rhizosphaerae]MDI5920993.1 glycosyltransferase family 2 protein [Halomonas rhizosphaerae]